MSIISPVIYIEPHLFQRVSLGLLKSLINNRSSFDIQAESNTDHLSPLPPARIPPPPLMFPDMSQAT